MYINELYSPFELTQKIDHVFLGRDGQEIHEKEMVLVEHMIDVYINEKLTMKLVCIPEHLAELVLGRLLSEGIIRGAEDVEAIYICEFGSRARVVLCNHSMPIDSFMACDSSVSDSSKTDDTSSDDCSMTGDSSVSDSSKTDDSSSDDCSMTGDSSSDDCSMTGDSSSDDCSSTVSVSATDNQSAATTSEADNDTEFIEVTPTCCTSNHILNNYFVQYKDVKKLTSIPWKKEWIFALADKFASGMPIHSKTWSTHSAFLAMDDQILFECEDIGRHNALDKAIGYAIRNNIDLKKCILYSSGRVPTDMVMKVIHAGVPIFASKASLTSEAVELAKKYNLTLICAARRDRMKFYAGRAPEE